MVHNATTAKGSKRDASNSKWITKEEFYEVFPNGYRENNFFSSPIEFWAMSKEACLNWKNTALIDLSLKLNWQRNLQQTYMIGHSSDSKLLTELLHQNSNNSNIESPMNTAINNDVNIDPDVLSKKISISKNKKCYTCSNVYKCSGLMSNRSKNHFRKNNCDIVTLLSKAQLVMPEIKLIDYFDKSSIKSSLAKKKVNLSNYTKNNKDVIVTTIAKPKDSKYCNMSKNGCDSEREKIFYGNNIMLSSTDIPDNIQSRSTSPLDDRVVTEKDAGQIIHDETNVPVDDSIDNESNEYDKNVLKYFHLNSISEIFQELQDDLMGMTM